MKIYTRRGDGGETGLLGGKRVPKDHPRVTALGELDELNASLGAARAFVCGRGIDGLLRAVQGDLFGLGVRLADSRPSPRADGGFIDARVREFERAIDRCQAALPSLRGFVIPGGGPAPSLLHVARAVCRRAERAAVALSRTSSSDPGVIRYLNRLSDLLFVLARVEAGRAGERSRRPERRRRLRPRRRASRKAP